jgi:acyl transferase domain-containing protein
MGQSFNGTEIAIIGMGGRYPKSSNLEQFWRHLREGDELISFYTEEQLAACGVAPEVLSNPNFVKAASVLDDIELFDASFFGFTPREAALLDPQHRLFLECAWEALEQSGYNSETYKGLIGVYAGTGIGSYFLANIMPNPEFGPLDQLSLLLSTDKDYMMTRASYKLNLRGPSVMVQTACSTSLVAIHMACQSLLNEECDMALAGASVIGVMQRYGYYSYEGGIYSPDGHCRPFDAEARGTIFGSGVGLVVLKRLEDALAEGDSIQAIIRGSAVNNDGAMKVSYTAPSVTGQAEVIAEALSNADVSADTISYVETHGTATSLGDSIEIQALSKAFRTSTQRKGFCAIGSVKSNLGHLDQAAGVTGVIKTVLCLQHKLIAPSLHFRQPNPALDLEKGPFYVNAALSEWPSGPTPRRAGVSSFGIGGTNAHLILEEAPPPPPSQPSRRWQLLLLSAKTESALEAATSNLVEHFKQHPKINLADAAYTLQVGRKAFEHRRMVVCAEPSDAIAALEARASKRVLTAVSESKEEQAVVFMFPGQGAQYDNMAAELYRDEPVFRAEVDRCSELLKPELDFDISQVLSQHEGSTTDGAEQLRQTALAQPALFVTEYALARLWWKWGVRPQVMIGHSLGEYVAACLAGVFSLQDALRLVAIRGRLMQALPPGDMLAVFLSEREVRSLMSPGLSLAAVNGSNSCVVSGPSEVVGALERRLAEANVICRRLQTSHAFHSEMMEPILAPFTEQLKKLKLNPPKIPYISNLTGTWITASEATDINYWAQHLRQTVRFADGMREVLKEPGRILLEVGPGQTLSTLARQSSTADAQPVVLSSMRHPKESESDTAFLISTVGKLWLAGVNIDWPGFYAQERRQRLSLPTYPFERKRYWIEPPAGGVYQATGNNKIPSPAETPDPHSEAETTPRPPVPERIEPVPEPQQPPTPHALSPFMPPPNGQGNGKPTTEEKPSAAQTVLEGILAQQLRLMSQQLNLLRTNRSNNNGDIHVRDSSIQKTR